MALRKGAAGRGREQRARETEPIIKARVVSRSVKFEVKPETGPRHTRRGRAVRRDRYTLRAEEGERGTQETRASFRWLGYSDMPSPARSRSRRARRAPGDHSARDTAAAALRRASRRTTRRKDDAPPNRCGATHRRHANGRAHPKKSVLAPRALILSTEKEFPYCQENALDATLSRSY